MMLASPQKHLHPQTRIGHVHLKVSDLERAITSGRYKHILRFSDEQAWDLTGHDAMHGTVSPRAGVNRAVGTLACFLFAGLCQSALVFWGVVEWPAIISPYAAGVLVVMGYAMSRDLANAKQLSIELRERNQEAALTAEAANLGTWTRDIAGDVILASGKTRELFGFAPGERLNLERVLERVHPDDRGLVFEQGQVPHSPHDGAYHTEFRVLLPDGRVRWIAHHGRAELDAGRRPVRTRGVSMDITSRKQADLEAARLRQDIAHVGRVSVMGQLASALAHEISQPLGAILRNAEAAALFMQDPSPDLAEIRAILEDIRKDDQRAGAVIDRMRALLRRQEVQMAALDVRQVLGDVTVLLRPDAAARHLRVDLDIAAGVPPVLGDRVQLQQVLLNLILNGMDALEGVGGDNRRVSVSARREASDTIAHADLDSVDRLHRHKPRRTPGDADQPTAHAIGETPMTSSCK